MFLIRSKFNQIVSAKTQTYVLKHPNFSYVLQDLICCILIDTVNHTQHTKIVFVISSKNTWSTVVKSGK